MYSVSRNSITLVFAFILVGCGATVGQVSTSATMLDSAPDDRPSVDVSEVSVYSSFESVECEYSRVAFVESTPRLGARNEKDVINSGKEKAAEIGANGLVIEEMDTSANNPQSSFVAIFESKSC